jgi:Big-like domain-containing protein/fibronectin type III domain protein
MSVAFTTLPGTGSEVHGVLKEDASTPADPFDMGAGRVDLRQSALVGFTLDETTANYEAANPGLGGDATTLNVASLGQDFCPTTCTWKRTLTGTAPGTVNWTTSATTPAGMTISVSPSSFSLAQGDEVTLTFTADVGGVSPKGEWTFAEVQLTPSASSVPPAHFPVAVIPAGGQPPVTLHFHGNLHDGCTGDGAADLATGGEDICTPFLGDDVLDTAPAAHWGPINTALDCTVDRCVSDPNWIWELTGETTLQGPMTIEWWYGGPGDNPLLFDDFEIRLYADGAEVLREVVRHTGTAPNVPHLLRSTVNVPRTTATGNFVLVIDPLFVNQNESFIYYDSEQACPGVIGGPACDSRVSMPVIDRQPQPPIANDDFAFVLSGGTVDIDVLANDSDPEGGPLAVEIVTPPANGTATVTLGQTISYTHDGSATTSDSLVYRITDNQGLTDTATVFITISDECLVPSGGYSDDFESGAPGWVVDTAVLAPPSQSWVLLSPDPFATSPTTVWFTDANAQDPTLMADTSKDVRLVSPAQHVSTTTHLTFFHRFNTETGFDGGVLEVSTDNGATWVDVVDSGGVFVAGAYGDMTAAGSGFVLSGRDTWGGLSDGFLTGDMNLTEVDLGALAGETINVRFRFGQDELTPQPAGGWWIDDVAFNSLLEPCAGTQPPVANDDAATVVAGGSVNTDVKANDSDPDTANADLNVTIEAIPTHGSAAVEADGTITYTHNGDTATSDSYQYRITDPEGGFDVATVSITIVQDNATPNAVDDSGSVAAGGSTTVDVKANDSDADHTNAQLTVTLETTPTHGAAGVNGDGSITYTHNGDSATSDSFQYRLTDPEGASDIATVTITVNQLGKTTGGGYLLTSAGDKLNFTFHVSQQADGSIAGNLQYSDKQQKVKIHLKDVLLFGALSEQCGSVLPGPGSAEFSGTGTYNGAAASFRVCVSDAGETGVGADRFHLECTDGCDYNTIARADEALAGGNIQVRNPGATASSSSTESSNAAATSNVIASTLLLDPVLLTNAPIGSSQQLTVRAFGPDQSLLAGVAISITVLDGTGNLLDTLTRVSDASGLVSLSVVIGAGETEFLAWNGSLSSNAISVTGVLPTGGGL